jgi:hypothetical protein
VPMVSSATPQWRIYERAKVERRGKVLCLLQAEREREREGERCCAEWSRKTGKLTFSENGKRIPMDGAFNSTGQS